MKRFLSLLLAVILTASLLPAVRAESGPAVSHNIDSHFYVNANRWADPIYSTLAAEDGGYLRVEYIGSSLFVERYDDSFHYLSGKEIPLELPIYGGVYLCDDYNFLLVGQPNLNEDDSVEVFRIIRYSKDWEKIDHASIYGANTTIPFDAGCPRFDRSGDILYIRASHEMYADENGVNHQANVMISLRVSDMTVTDQLTKTWNNSYGYVSHSFNQFVRVDGDTLLAVDHGDYYPRSVALFKYSAKAGSETFYSRTQMVNVLPIVNSTYHYNDTGVCVGGFEYSSTDYLVAGCAYDMSSSIDLMEAHRNIFVTATPKNNCTDEATEIHWLTSYSADDGVTVSPPHFLKISSDRFFLIWTENGVVKCCFLNGKGQLDSYVLTVEGSLSDCQPIFDGNRIIWYTTDFSVPQFFQIRPNSPAFNPNAVAYGKAGDDVEWAVYNNGLLELTGTGPMYDYDYAKTPWYAHRSSIQRISVGSGITSLGENAFASCTKATEVSLPDSLKQIGAGAFYLCSNLTEVSVPQGVTELGDNVFHGCTSLASVSLPEGLQTIGIKAFCECTALTQLTVPEGVTSLGKEAFYHCAALQTVSLPATLTQIGDQAFQLCHKLNAITVAPGSASFSHDNQGALYNRDKTALLRVPGAFQGTFVIPSTVTSVAKQAADYCSGLTAVQIPDSVTSLGVEAFAYCDLRQVIIPRTVTVLPAGCFTTNPHLTSVTIPETVTEIRDSVFSYCESLTAATLPAGLKVLGNSVFWGCSQLQSIVIPEGITALEQAVFYDCSALETVQLPSRLTSINTGASRTAPA